MSDDIQPSRKSGSAEFVTFEIADRLFGVEVCEIHDVFPLHAVTPVPLARSDIAGLLNLRGRVVTAIDPRHRLGLPKREGGYRGAMAIGIERGGENYGLVIDRIGEVLRLNWSDLQPNPTHLDPAWGEISLGVFRLEARLLVLLNVDKVMDAGGAVAAAA